jgi:hypothetical protein
MLKGTSKGKRKDRFVGKINNETYGLIASQLAMFSLYSCDSTPPVEPSVSTTANNWLMTK